MLEVYRRIFLQRVSLELLIVLLLAFSIWVAHVFPLTVSYKHHTFTELAAFFISYFFMILLIELFIQSSLGLFFKHISARLKHDRNEKGQAKQHYYESEESQTDLEREKLLEHDYEAAREADERFKIMRTTYYYFGTLLVCLLLSYSGLRMLSYFVDISVVSHQQQTLFNLLDMLVTAGALAGGGIGSTENRRIDCEL